MDFTTTLAVFGVIWHVFAIANLIMLAPFGKRWEGFYLGVLLGPVGTFISIIMREKAKEARDREEFAKMDALSDAGTGPSTDPSDDPSANPLAPK
jgi:hypothetical protein